MFYAKLNEGIIFKNIIQSIKGLFDDLEIEISFQEIYIQKLIKSGIAIAFIKLPSKCFEEFKCKEGFQTGISIISLEKVLNDMDDEDCLILICDNPQKLIIKLENPKINKISEYEIPLNENCSFNKFLILDKANSDATIILPSKQFEKIINDLNAAGIEISIKCYSDGKARFYIENEIERNIMIESNNEGELEKYIKVESDKEIKFRLNAGILTEFSKASLVSKQVKLALNENCPFLAEYKIGEFGLIKFYLCPII